MDIATALTSVRNDNKSDNEMNMTPVMNNYDDEEDPESQLKSKRPRGEMNHQDVPLFKSSN
jgi:hypothetical protein